MKTLLRMMPLCIHCPTRPRIEDGRDQMKGSMRTRFGPVGSAVPISHTRTTATRMIAWRPRTSGRLRAVARIARKHFLTYAAPHALVDLPESWREPRLHHIARPRQIDRIVSLEARPGSSRQEQYAVRKSDRLFQ